MKSPTMRWLLASVFLLLFSPMLNAATIDLTANEWNFDAVLFDGAMGATSGFDGSILSFDTQTPTVGGFALTGSLEWAIGGVPMVTSSVTGIYDGADSIAFIANTHNVIWTLFQGIVDDTGGNFMVGQLDGLFRSDMNGFWFATNADTRIGVIPLPNSGWLLMSAAGGLMVIGRVRSNS